MNEAVRFQEVLTLGHPDTSYENNAVNFLINNVWKGENEKESHNLITLPDLIGEDSKG